MKSLSRILSAAGLAMGLALTAIPAEAQQKKEQGGGQAQAEGGAPAPNATVAPPQTAPAAPPQ